MSSMDRRNTEVANLPVSSSIRQKERSTDAKDKLPDLWITVSRGEEVLLAVGLRKADYRCKRSRCSIKLINRIRSFAGIEWQRMTRSKSPS